MKDLVVSNNGIVLTDTQIIAKELGLKHAYVMDVVRKFLDDYPDLRVGQTDPKTGEYISLVDRNYRGKDFKAAVMNRECFTLLFMRFETPKARAAQRQFIAAFFDMERALLNTGKSPDWNRVRAQGKLVRREETDVIKDFVEYATKQGSQNAQFYYKHITMACYGCLQLIEAKKPKLRDMLDLMELHQLVMAEVVAKRSLLKHMAEGEHYKAIFALVKHDLDKYADSIMLPALPK